MSLATRCAQCGTVFRVVQDQLKVSEGWVRCGRCDAVFNALEGLFDLVRDPPADWDPGQAAMPSADAPAIQAKTSNVGQGDTIESPAVRPADPTSIPVVSRASDRSAADGFPATAPVGLDLLADPIDAHLFRKRGGEVDRSTSAKVDARDRLEFSDARFDSDLFADNSASQPDLVESQTSDLGALPLESEHGQPDFVRRAERRARWKSGPVRATLSAACVLGVVLLILQAAHHFRDGLAADWPSTRPVLSAWCRAAGCVLEAPRRIEDLSVENSALTRAIGLDAFVLSIAVKSRSSVALAMPFVDLGLTDGNGLVVARRVLRPRDFGASGIIPPRSDTALQLMLNAGSARVAGYTVDIFYP